MLPGPQPIGFDRDFIALARSLPPQHGNFGHDTTAISSGVSAFSSSPIGAWIASSARPARRALPKALARSPTAAASRSRPGRHAAGRASAAAPPRPPARREWASRRRSRCELVAALQLTGRAPADTHPRPAPTRAGAVLCPVVGQHHPKAQPFAQVHQCPPDVPAANHEHRRRAAWARRRFPPRRRTRPGRRPSGRPVHTAAVRGWPSPVASGRPPPRGPPSRRRRPCPAARPSPYTSILLPTWRGTLPRSRTIVHSAAAPPLAPARPGPHTSRPPVRHQSTSPSIAGQELLPAADHVRRIEACHPAAVDTAGRPAVAACWSGQHQPAEPRTTSVTISTARPALRFGQRRQAPADFWQPLGQLHQVGHFRLGNAKLEVARPRTA